MIKAILILNTSGKVRLSRVYDDNVNSHLLYFHIYYLSRQSITNIEAVISELNLKIGLRKDHYCNFIDDCVSVISPNKVVYR